GLARAVVERCFPDTPCPVGGVGFAELELEALGRIASPVLENPGYVKFRKGGEPHETNPDVVDAAHALRKAVNGGGAPAYRRFAELVNGRDALELRDLLELASTEPVPLDEVEPATEIVRRFSSGG